jgi:glycosyltransferase involved in cell wall biosynthesis
MFAMRKKKIMLYWTLEGACKWYRIDNLKLALELSGKYEVDISYNILPKHYLQYDAFLLQRTQSPLYATNIVEFSKSGKPFIIENDDNIWHHPDYNPAFYQKDEFGPDDGGQINIKFVTEYMKRATAIITSTGPLSQEMSKMNEHVHVIPNYFNKCWIPQNMPKRTKAKRAVIIGYPGSLAHYGDLKICIDAIKTVLINNPLAVFCCFGAEYDFIKDLPRKQVLVIPAVKNVEDYLKILSTFDICIAPLLDNTYNRCKSWVKYIEPSALGIPVVASNVFPYRIINDEVDGLLIKTKGKTYQDWVSALDNLVHDEEYRMSLGESATNKIFSNYMIQSQKNIDSIVAIFDEIMVGSK